MRMTDAPEKVEVITSVQRRRRWNAAEKMRMVEESREPGASVSLVARRHGVNPNQLFTWRRLAAHDALTAAVAGEEVVPASDYRALQEQIRELHRLLGKKTLEAEIRREALQHADPKKDCCCAGHCRRAAVPGEGRGQDPRRGPLQPGTEACPATAPRSPASAGEPTARADQGHHRGAANLWLSARARPPVSSGRARRTPTSQSQTGLADHESPRPAAGPPRWWDRAPA